MNNILIIAGRYLPGYKDGGPVRTIKNLTDLLGDKYHFTICCADRDHGDEKPYDSIIASDGDDAKRLRKSGDKSCLNQVGKADVFYVKDCRFSFSLIKNLCHVNDLVYVCGPYNEYAIKTLLLNRFGKIKCPLVLAPMGSFSKGALSIKSIKKKVFFSLVKVFKLFKNVIFSVTSEVEERELRDALKIENRCFIAKDPQRAVSNELIHKSFKKDGKLQVVFLSRISEKKNLLGAIEILSKVEKDICFSIYGNIEDKEYYDKCIDKLEKLPNNISWEYKGTADSERVPEIMSSYDVFLFPTHGENFGHVISEALSAGTIPVISDTTPWLDFDECGAGFVVCHGDVNAFSKVLSDLCDMSEDKLKQISDNAVKYYKKNYEDSINNNGYMEMFNELLR